MIRLIPKLKTALYYFKLKNIFAKPGEIAIPLHETKIIHTPDGITIKFPNSPITLAELASR